MARHIHTFCRRSRVCACGRRWEDYLCFMWGRRGIAGSGRRARWCAKDHACNMTILEDLARL